MAAFVIFAAILILFALTTLLPILWRGRSVDRSLLITQPELHEETSSMRTADDVTHESVNVGIARKQIEEIEALLASGDLDQDSFAERKLEIERSLASSLSVGAPAPADVKKNKKGWLVCLFVAFFIPIVSIAGYWYIGRPETLNLAWVQQQNELARNPQSNQNMENLPPVEELLPKLEAHLAENPEDLQGWRLLGVTYSKLQQLNKAGAAFEKAVELSPDDNELLLLLADVTARIGGGLFEGRPLELVRRVLSTESSNPTAIWMLGIAQEQAGEYQDAIDSWRSLLPSLSSNPRALQEVQKMIDEVSVSAGITVEANNNTVNANDNGKSVSLRVSVPETIRETVPADALVYIYVKAVSGPPMPLAVHRTTVSKLPLTITLNDADSMMPSMVISSFEQVTVGARISLTGNPVAQPGDIYIEAGPVTPIAGSQADIPTIDLEITETAQ